MERLEVMLKKVAGAQSRLDEVGLLADHPTVTNVTKRALKTAIGALSELDHHITSQINRQEVLPEPDDEQEELPTGDGKKKK